jgi:hypothetical protein
VAIRILAGGSVTGTDGLTGQDAHPSPLRAFILVIVEAMRAHLYGDAEIHSDACSEAGPAFASWTKPTSGGGHPVIPWPQGTPWPRSQHAAINPPISTFASLTAASASNTRRTLP